tara:strand:- start:31 stop:405 length:375 start_codon:yes stop_codon:yes gene_type:complete
MFAFITIGTNNLNKSAEFYDKLFKIIGIVRSESSDRYIGYSKENNLKFPEFYLMIPHNKKIASVGNGAMITFDAKSKENVDKLYKIAINNGGMDEGMPGPRHGEHYYAYFRDLDGNKICVFSQD